MAKYNGFQPRNLSELGAREGLRQGWSDGWKGGSIDPRPNSECSHLEPDYAKRFTTAYDVAFKIAKNEFNRQMELLESRARLRERDDREFDHEHNDV